jgi:excisionase family DNA binding protein
MNNRIRITEANLPLLLKGTEVAELLGVSRALAYRWMADNTLPVVRVPGSRSTRVPRSELLDWLEANTHRPAGNPAV